MARGLPVAASQTSVMPEVLGEAAVYFDPYDPDDMARVINQTLEDKTSLAKLKTKGLVQAQKYSWEKMARETLALYKKVLNNTWSGPT
jgi:glycosyltransferase involved in cell wall biosynthesis